MNAVIMPLQPGSAAYRIVTRNAGQRIRADGKVIKRPEFTYVMAGKVKRSDAGLHGITIFPTRAEAKAALPHKAGDK